MSTKAAPAQSNSIATNILQLLSDLEYDASVTEPISRILKAMRQRVEYEAAQLKAIDSEKAELADKYHRYQELNEAEFSKSQLLMKLEAIVGRTDHLRHVNLWEILEVYLSFVTEAQVADILGFFEWIGYKTTRQAVESIIKTHKHRFAVRKDGWDRFISLARKEKDAASTNDRRK
jgi:hypothetical protein